MIILNQMVELGEHYADMPRQAFYSPLCYSDKQHIHVSQQHFYSCCVDCINIR